MLQRETNQKKQYKSIKNRVAMVQTEPVTGLISVLTSETHNYLVLLMMSQPEYI